MDYLAEIRIRFGFELPEDYVVTWNSGLIDRNSPTYLRISRHAWLSPSEIANFELPTVRKIGFVPCASTESRGQYCWCVSETLESFIADCPRDSDFADGYAPHFEGFLFRSLIEEFSDCWITGQLDVASGIFKVYAKRASSVLRPEWGEILMSFANSAAELNPQGNPHVISEQNATLIIDREMSFPMFGEEISQSNL